MNATELWQLSPEQFNEWRRENDYPLIWDLLVASLPYFSDWMTEQKIEKSVIFQIGIARFISSRSVLSLCVYMSDDKIRLYETASSALESLRKSGLIRSETRFEPYCMWLAGKHGKDEVKRVQSLLSVSENNNVFVTDNTKEIVMVQASKWLVWVGLMMASALSWPVQAGDPGPYRLAFVDISAAPYQDGQRLAIELRNMESLPVAQKEFCFLCSSMTESSDSVEMLYVYTLPVGLDIDELRLAVAGDKAAAQRMQTVIHHFADAEGRGIDGLLIYLHQAGKVSVYTMGRKVGSKLSEESKPVKNRLLHSSLDTLLENAASKIARPV